VHLSPSQPHPAASAAAAPRRDEVEGREPLYFILSEVLSGNRLALPEPSEVTPPLPEAADVLELARACWRQDPGARPTMDAVASRLRGIINAIKVRRRAEQALRAGGGSGSGSGAGGGPGGGSAASSMSAASGCPL
jgi:hypothetical protein